MYLFKQTSSFPKLQRYSWNLVLLLLLWFHNLWKDGIFLPTQFLIWDWTTKLYATQTNCFFNVSIWLILANLERKFKKWKNDNSLWIFQLYSNTLSVPYSFDSLVILCCNILWQTFLFLVLSRYIEIQFSTPYAYWFTSTGLDLGSFKMRTLPTPSTATSLFLWLCQHVIFGVWTKLIWLDTGLSSLWRETGGASFQFSP